MSWYGDWRGHSEAARKAARRRQLRGRYKRNLLLTAGKGVLSLTPVGAPIGAVESSYDIYKNLKKLRRV